MRGTDALSWRATRDVAEVRAREIADNRRAVNEAIVGRGRLDRQPYTELPGQRPDDLVTIPSTSYIASQGKANLSPHSPCRPTIPRTTNVLHTTSPHPVFPTLGVSS